jgi:protein-L-isoaspartate(D-aspartate) O-methyltransferase
MVTIQPSNGSRVQVRTAEDEQYFAQRRMRMVEEQIEGRGIRDAAVLVAMKTIPREVFVADRFKPYAYEDMPLPIPAGQTISQPYMVAYMISVLELQPSDRVLEIGTGSGYAAAILSRVAKEVYTIERHKRLVAYARWRLARLGYDNVWLHHGNGTLGWAEHAPYDAIIVAAGGPHIPSSLAAQLAVNGRLVMPVGRCPYQQSLVLITRQGEDQFARTNLGPVAFVPLIGEKGWEEDG